MTYNEAIILFNKKFSKLIVTRCIDYDEHHFVVEAIEDFNTANYNDPYYGINKHTGKITAFIPAFDLDAFFEALETRTVYAK